MKLNNAHKEELLFNLDQLLTRMDEPVFVVDQSYKIVYTNKAFEQFSHREMEGMLGLNYGDGLGCNYLNKDNQVCGSTYACSMCGFRRSIDAVFDKEEPIVHDLVRDFNVDGETIFKQVYYSALPMKISGLKYVGVIMTEVKQAASDQNQ